MTLFDVDDFNDFAASPVPDAAGSGSAGDGAAFTDLVATFGEIGARLRTPLDSCNLAGLTTRLRRATLVHRIAGWGRLAADFGLPGRIRGAFGNVLAETASEEARQGRPCPWQPPCAFEVLFRKPGRLTPGTDFPSPWVIALNPRRGDLEVRLTVFGMATEWLPATAEAMTAALLRVDWSGTAGAEPTRLGALRLVERRLEPGPDLPLATPELAPVRCLVIDTLSPLASSGDSVLTDPAAAFTPLWRRLEGLARWQETTLAVDGAALAADLRAARWTWAVAKAVTWKRGSRRQGGRVIPMGGVIGRLEIEAEPERLARFLPLLTLGEAVHAGADIAFGCGRYRLSVFG